MYRVPVAANGGFVEKRKPMWNALSERDQRLCLAIALLRPSVAGFRDYGMRELVNEATCSAGDGWRPGDRA